MDGRDLLRASIKTKFLKMHAGKKQFPSKNLHYLTSLSPTKQRVFNSSEQREVISNLKNLIHSKNSELKRLREEYRREQEKSVSNKSLTPKRYKEFQTSFMAKLASSPNIDTKKFYFTKKSPKPLADNPITGVSSSLQNSNPRQQERTLFNKLVN